MGKLTNTGQTGAELTGTDDLSAATMTSRSHSFPDDLPAGEDGYEGIIDFVESLMQADLPLADAATWKETGLRGHAQLVQKASRYAMEAARVRYECGMSKAGFVATADTLDNHPAHDFEAALGWLFKSNTKLFSDRSYARLGGSADAFFNTMQKSYCDLVFQTVRVADAMLDANPEDAGALTLIQNVWTKYFTRLGVDTLNDRVADATGITKGEIDAVEHRATRARLRTQLRETNRLMWRDRNSRAYHESVISAWETLCNDETIRVSPDAFEGMIFNAETFEKAFDASIEALLRTDIQKLADKDMDMAALYAFGENLQYWRSLFEAETEIPDNISPDYSDEDFWHAGLMREFEYRSFTHLLETVKTTYASCYANEILQARQNDPHSIDPEEVYDTLTQCRDMLKDSRVPIERESALTNLRLHRDQFFDALDETAISAATRDWNHAHHIGMTTADRIRLIMSANQAVSRITATQWEQYLPASMRHAAVTEYKLKLRRAEEIFALSRVSLEERGVYLPLREGFDLLTDLGKTIFSRDILDKMGMSEAQARRIDALFGRVDMATLWDQIVNDDESLTQRLVYFMEFEDRLNKMDASRAVELIGDMGLKQEDYNEMGAQIARDAMNQAVENMSLAPNDTLGNAEHLQLIRNALMVINPDALKHPAVFKRLTNKDLDQFIAIESDALKRAEALCSPTSDRFTIAKDIAAKGLTEAAGKKNYGAAGWYMLRDIRHKAAITGFSLRDPEVLAAAGMTQQELTGINQAHALRAARDCFENADARGLGSVSLKALDQHAYHDYRMALKWIGRSGISVLADGPYQAMGLASRAEFMERARESLFDYAMEIENAICREGLNAGPVKYLEAMREMRDMYKVMGFDHARDDRAVDTPEQLMANAVNLTRVRHALTDVGPAACMSILNSQASLPAKYRGVVKILTFSARLGRRIAEGAMEQKIADGLSGVIKGRISNLLEKFTKAPDDMARGWRIAQAIETLRVRHGLEEMPWFEPLFRHIGYADFKTFTEMMAINRIDQLNRRIFRRLNTDGADTLGDPVLNRDILLDVGSMQSVIQSPLIPDERVDAVLNAARVSQDWIDAAQRTSAVIALPLLIDIALDPTAKPEERLDLLEDVFGLRTVAGSENRIVRKMAWQDATNAYGDTAAQVSAQYLALDMLRGENPVMSDTIVTLETVLRKAMISMADPAHLMAIGLHAHEAEAYAKLHPLITPYIMVQNIEKLSPEHDIAELHNAILQFHTYMQQRQLDVNDPSVQRALGIRSDAEMLEIIDLPTLSLACGFRAGFENIKNDPARAESHLKTVEHFMKATRLETRLAPDMLTEHDIPTTSRIQEMLARFGTGLMAANVNTPTASPT